MTKIGIIGCGNISTAYLQLIPAFNSIEVTAVADVNLETAKAQGKQFNVAAMSVDELLKSDVDIVLNLTIPAAHFDVSAAALKAGKHVYSEKPFVLTLDEGLALKKIADERDLRIGSAPDTFLGGAHQSARAAIDEGNIGEVVGGTCHVMSHGMEDWHPNPDFFFQEGGGPILDLGPYYLSNLVQLIGPVKTVQAMASSATPTRTINNGPRLGEKIPVETPTNIHALLEFHSGAIVTLGASWDVWAHRHKEMELYGLDASIYIPDPNFFGGEVVIADASGEHDFSLDNHPFYQPNFDDGDRKLANYRGAGLADMAAAIRENRPHRCSFEFALHVVEIMTAILGSADIGEKLTMSTTATRPAALDQNAAQELLKS